MWLDPQSLLLTEDVGFCPAHAAPTCRVDRDAHLPSTPEQSGEITLCFSKPTCSSCYHDSICNPPCDENHNKTWYPWNSCECRQSLFCDSCYHEAKSHDGPFCRFCEGINEDAENPSDEDNDASLSEEDVYDFYIATVDWTSIRAFEELGIARTSRLGRLIIELLSLGKVDPVNLFKILDTVLGDDPVLLHLITSVQGCDNMKDIESVDSGDEGGNLEDWMIVNSGLLGQLVSQLDVTE
jgi:hypothetical protein